MGVGRASHLYITMQSYFNPHIIAKYDIVCSKVMKLFARVKNENNNIPSTAAWDLFKAYFTKFTMKFESFRKYKNSSAISIIRTDIEIVQKLAKTI